MTISFNIISGGPSRAYLDERDLMQDDPEGDRVATVTINRALDVVERGINVDFAAFVDGPKGIWKELDYQRFWKPGMILWIAHHALQSWEESMIVSIGFRLLPLGTVPYGVSGFQRHVFSTLSVLEKCFSYKPKKVRILSADMVGPWEVGKTEEECERGQGCVANFNKTLGNLVIQAERLRKDGKQVPKELKEAMATCRSDRDRSIAQGETHFRRWDHEKKHLLLASAKAKEAWGCEVEMRSPLGAAVA